MKYKISSRDFLRRARARLDEERPESLIYAALELRLGVEVRLKKYNDALEEFSIKKKKGWKISILDRNLEKAFRTGKQITELMFIDIKTDKPQHILYHTPLSKTLINNSERIGNLLHAQKIFLTQNEEWYDETKLFLDLTYSELHKANRGTLLAPPMRNPKTGESKFFIEAFEGYEPIDVFKKIGFEGAEVKINISYSDDYPEIEI